MMNLARVRVHAQGPLLVASVEGEIDLSNASEVADQLFRAVPNTAIGVVIDLSQTRYLDSRGVHLLLQMLERLRVRQQQSRLVVPDRSPLRMLFRILSVTEAVGVHPTLQAAVADLRPHVEPS